VFVAPDQLDILTAQNIQGTPALMIEVLSPSARTRDREIKRRLYDRAGVREYWLVDPDLNTVIVYRRATDGAFPGVAALTAGAQDVPATPLMPGGR
jgi:Uma2 family endonuclease